jgi:GNAT superfamily N-acetyltransferase
MQYDRYARVLCSVSPVSTETDGMTFTVLPVTASHTIFARVAELFDAYRGHYGANPAPEATERWLREQLTWDRLKIFAAEEGDQVAGMATVAVVPAALTLRTVWMIRDLYVDPGHRREGVAGALLTHVTDAARVQGAHRVSLQTEVGNTAAQALYASFGFEPVTGLTLLNRLL